MKRALLLVDVQNDFLPMGALPVPHGDEVIEPINRLMKLPFDVIVATKDFHPVGHCSFASRWNKTVGETIQIQNIDQLLWPDHCVQGTMGAEFAPGLDTSRITQVVHKGSDPEIDSYSTFFDNKKLRSTGLEKFFLERSIKELYIAGLATNFCVLFSVADAINLGFDVTVIEDGCRGIDITPGAAQKSLLEMKEMGAHLTSSDQLISHWNSKPLVNDQGS